MPAYSDLVLNNVCRSNHHRLAIMALDHLKDKNAELWRDLFLKWHATYIEGSKAPDEEFKDFKNHVLHPGEGKGGGDWGGAPQAAREWYKRTVRALAEQDWEHAAWSAGVMSHYVVDPCQPFHTGQTEAEGHIHRPAEWSFSKCFPELKLIIEQHTGYPDVKVPAGDDWLEQMVRNAALNSHPHYNTLIDHYNLEVGVHHPKEGLDQELKDTIAALLAYASVLLARILDRAFEEAKVAPPKVNLTMDTIAISAKAPLHAIRKANDHAADKKAVQTQYAEFRRTGKVRETLSEDDKVVRSLHADEVLDKHLSSVDAEWPREHGTAHGTGAEPRVHKKLKKTKPQPDKAASSKAPPTAKAPPKMKTPKVKPSTEEAHATAADYYEAKHEALKAEAASEPAAAPKTAEEKSAEGKGPRVRLTREASVVDAPSIGPKTAGRLQVIGVKTVGDLLELSPDEAAQKIKASHINARQIKDWQAQALLACSVPDISGTTAQMLVGAGVSTPADLASADPAFLLKAIMEFANSREGEQALRGAAAPDQAKVEKWIASAQSRAA